MIMYTFHLAMNLDCDGILDSYVRSVSCFDTSDVILFCKATQKRTLYIKLVNQKYCALLICTSIPV